MANPTNYSSSSLNSTGYGIQSAITDPSFLLLEDNSSYFLLENNASKLILEEGIIRRVNYLKTNPNSTNYAVPTAS